MIFLHDMNHIILDKVNELEKTKHGIFKNIFNYGDVTLSVAGMKGNVHLENIRRPSKFVNLIEAVKLGTPLERLDLKGIGAVFSDKYLKIKK